MELPQVSNQKMRAEDRGKTLRLPDVSNSDARTAGLQRFFADPRLAAGIPFAALVITTLLFRWTSADVWVVSLFHGSLTGEWPYLNASPCCLIYKYGIFPGYLLGFGGLFLWISRRFKWDLMSRRAVFLALSLALGPGLIVNGILKPQLHRPRPNQITQFGGQHAFTPVLSINGSEITKSFPSGHASMGFYLISPAFLLVRKRPRAAVVIMALGFAAGLTLGVTRVVQGRHFPSDVVWSAAVVYFVSLILYYGLHLHLAQDESPAGFGNPPIKHIDDYRARHERPLRRAA